MAAGLDRDTEYIGCPPTIGILWGTSILETRSSPLWDTKMSQK